MVAFATVARCKFWCCQKRSSGCSVAGSVVGVGDVCGHRTQCQPMADVCGYGYGDDDGGGDYGDHVGNGDHGSGDDYDD